jgi:hypothetical protein
LVALHYDGRHIAWKASNGYSVDGNSMPKFILTQAAFRVGVKLIHMLWPLSLEQMHHG